MADVLEIAGTRIEPGERRRVGIPIADSYGQGTATLNVVVVRGRRPGPVLFVSAAVHGDELNGVEIVRRLLEQKALRRLRGTLLAVPIVNVFGFTNQSRYLPDRRDLNRSFPGSPTGSLASRVANSFMTEVVAHATHGIDLHTGGLHRTNLPQIRACLDDDETRRLAHAFGVPVILDSSLRDGSLREAVRERDLPVLLYEAGEALRLDEIAVRAGMRGVLAVMRALEMLPRRAARRHDATSVVARRSFWVRSPSGGMLLSSLRLGHRVKRGEELGRIASPVQGDLTSVTTPAGGIVIGRATLPLVYEGDALFHIAVVDDAELVAGEVEAFRAALHPDGLADEPLRDGEDSGDRASG